jgi:hypothetical protein
MKTTIELLADAVFLIEDKRLRELIISLVKQLLDEQHKKTMEILEK